MLHKLYAPTYDLSHLKFNMYFTLTLEHIHNVCTTERRKKKLRTNQQHSVTKVKRYIAYRSKAFNNDGRNKKRKKTLFDQSRQQNANIRT